MILVIYNCGHEYGMGGSEQVETFDSMEDLEEFLTRPNNQSAGRGYWLEHKFMKAFASYIKIYEAKEVPLEL